jgi:23S rRNA A1618 N6-methylase RlmF
MAIDLNLLKQEIQNDPSNLGYASSLAIRDDISLANILNTVRSGSDYIVTKGRITRDQFVEDTTSVVYNLMVLESQGSDKAVFWLRVFDRLVSNSDTINALDVNFIGLLDQMIADNVLTSEEKSSILNRQGSRSEVLFGRVVSVDEVSNSLNEVSE